MPFPCHRKGKLNVWKIWCMLNKNDKKWPILCTHFTLFLMGLGANTKMSHKGFGWCLKIVGMYLWKIIMWEHNNLIVKMFCSKLQYFQIFNDGSLMQIDDVWNVLLHVWKVDINDESYWSSFSNGNSKCKLKRQANLCY